MKISYLGQGFDGTSDNAVGHYLMDFLRTEDFETFIGISAFASESAVYGISEYIEIAKQNFNSVNLIVGVDLNGTSKEALERILSLNINSYIFYQQEPPVFHPKIYLFEGEDQIKLILGSSNLTRGGLFTNVESSMLFEFATGNEKGMALLAELKSYHQSLFDFSDQNLFKINQQVIDDFYSKGIVPDETARRKIYSKAFEADSNAVAPSTANPSTSPIVIPKRSTAKIPDSFPSQPRRAQATTSLATTILPQATAPATPTQKVLVWQKPSLSRSDAQSVAAGTNPTGNLKLSQARFRVNGNYIDQNTYFRNTIFQHLKWAKPKPHSLSYEEAIGSFEITILGVSYGNHSIKLSHDPVRISNQANVSTWLHWGHNLTQILQQTALTGRTLNFYQTGSHSYSIEIV